MKLPQVGIEPTTLCVESGCFTSQELIPITLVKQKDVFVAYKFGTMSPQIMREHNLQFYQFIEDICAEYLEINLAGYCS
jgi:hypothetical protein